MPDGGIDNISVVTWIRDTVGDSLPAYLLDISPQSIPSVSSRDAVLTNRQKAVIEKLNEFRTSIPPELAGVSIIELLSQFLMQIHEGNSVARILRLHSTGGEQVPVGRDELENTLIELALDAYSSFLFPVDITSPFIPGLTSLLFKHPKSEEFSTLVLQDKSLGGCFSNSDEPTERMATVFRNTGGGGSLQLVMLPDIICRNAWRHNRGNEISPEVFAWRAIEELRAIRQVLAGKEIKVVARVDFTGVLLPPGSHFDIENGVVRPALDHDRAWIPGQLDGQLSTTDEEGVTTVINYGGDIVLEYSYPYKVKVLSGAGPDIDRWPVGVQIDPRLEHAALRLRFSLMISVERAQRAQLVQTWRFFDEPLSNGYSGSWNDPRQGAQITPMQLTEVEVVKWKEWYTRISEAPIEKIELTFSRILKAMAERRDLSDVLVDSVIAWENLFGTKDGEPTFRVTTCMAKLLADTTKERIELKSYLGKIYGLRSKIVHGGGHLQDGEYAMCSDALDFAVRVVKVLLSERMDLLAMSDGAERSAALLLEI